MKFSLKIAISLAILTIFAVACQRAVEFRKYADENDVPRITLADAKKDFDAGKVVFIDSRADAAFNSEHIAGAINMPFGSPLANTDKLPKGKRIIVYCS